MLGKLTSVTAGVVLLCTTPAEVERNDRPLTCYEDEVVVWTGEAHDACVALDDMWCAIGSDGTRTVHWYQEDERR